MHSHTFHSAAVEAVATAAPSIPKKGISAKLNNTFAPALQANTLALSS